MDSRSFFVFRGSDCRADDFRSKAMSSLTQHQVGRFTVEAPQFYAWEEELRALDPVCTQFPECTVALEYMIPRMGKRVDSIVIVGRYVFVVEFKANQSEYLAGDIDQVCDYAYDLKSFHSESHEKALFPILVCTEASRREWTRPQASRSGIYSVQLVNKDTLSEAISRTISSIQLKDPPLDHHSWLNAQYKPTPTIIEAARSLYQGNTVESISRSEAGETNINATTACVNKLVALSRERGSKSICFITGVPGAGKTLVGLNLASQRRTRETEEDDSNAAVFLSGNGPLIEVLQASLVEDQMRRNKEQCDLCKQLGQGMTCADCPAKKTKHEICSDVHSFVQGVHLFREELFTNDDPPHEHIAIFDEAQRAWSEEHLSYKMRTRWQNKRDIQKSEPECLIEYMDRHDDWACMICLVGGGQEINKGEAGISEWFKALRDHFPHWDVYAPEAIGGENYLGQDGFDQVSSIINVENHLHLSVDMRSFRNKNVAAFAEALVSNNPAQARDLYKAIEHDYPVYITRDLNAAKDWVRAITERPSDRYGVVADSYGQRIRADGIIVPIDFDAVKWFLRGKDEIDSSYYMEIAASEFKIQGLEIDYAVVAWEGDYRYRDGAFEYHRFYGGRWQNVNSEMPRRYLKNGYRVLLTRARQGYVIYVPKGSSFDQTRKPEFYDGTYEYLIESGIKELPTSTQW